MSKTNSLAELDALIKRASAAKQTQLSKAAAKVSDQLDADSGQTTKPSTGEQAAFQEKAQQRDYPDNAVDKNADDTPVGASVTKSTDGATAVATDGQEGGKGAMLSIKGKADNGPEDTDSPDNNGFNSGAFKQAAAELRKRAEALVKIAEASISPLGRFLANAVRNAPDAKLAKQAQEMPMDDLAGTVEDDLMARIEAGEIGEEEAMAILEEAVASGAVSEEDLAAAAAEMEAAGAAGAPAPTGDMPPAPVDEMAGDPLAEDMQAKLASADIGPDHPDYLKKLAAEQQDSFHAGASFFEQLLKKAQEVAAEEEIPTPAEDTAVGEEDLLAAASPEEQAALAAVQQELGISDEELAALMAEEIPGEVKLAMVKAASALRDAEVDPAMRYRAIIMNKVAATKSK
jgi:hypothetical protein